MISDLDLNLNKTDRVGLKPIGFWFVVAALLVCFDQVSKLLVAWSDAEIFLNENFAFSLPLPVWVMYLIYLIVFGLMYKYLQDNWAGLAASEKLGFTLILSGGISNVSERLILGSVRDFIFIANGVFNFADFFILIGMAIVIIGWWGKPKRVS